MAPDTDSAKPDQSSLGLRWSGGLPLASRILAVNIVPLALLAGSFFYLDGFRTRLIEERLLQAESESRLVAQAIGKEDARGLTSLVARLGGGDSVRIRIVDANGRVVADNWADGRRGFTLPDPQTERWQRQVARRLDEAIDWMVGAEVPPLYRDHGTFVPNTPDRASLSLAPDRTHMIEAHARVASIPGMSVVTLRNARDIRRFVRAERTRLAYMIGITAAISILLSLFLAQTIVRPLKALAKAARNVRFGQAREVVVPRLPSRRDEIGNLARSVSDMTHALRERIDAIEAFAADVAHELKNPLASMGSAVETLGKVNDPKLAAKLQAIIADDVQRLDRLISDISDLSRIDARLSKTRFVPVDVGKMIENILALRKQRVASQGVRIAFARPAAKSTIISGSEGQLARVIENLLDNAISFSPPKGTVRISATRTGGDITISVDDDGPGIPENARESVFERFHSDRPEAEFGRHSGLGLAIARTIVEAHGGTIKADASPPGKGARFVVALPAARG